jgi:RimJ/RimL family protein N-acetyltransferase
MGSPTIREGSIDELIANLGLIRKEIPEKASLDPSEVIERLAGRRYGIKLVEEDAQVTGVFTWYEEEGSLYLWLGALSSRGSGLGTEVLRRVMQETCYSRWYAKVHRDNIAARAQLGKLGFCKYQEQGELIYLEKIFS